MLPAELIASAPEDWEEVRRAQEARLIPLPVVGQLPSAVTPDLSNVPLPSGPAPVTNTVAAGAPQDGSASAPAVANSFLDTMRMRMAQIKSGTSVVSPPAQAAAATEPVITPANVPPPPPPPPPELPAMVETSAQTTEKKMTYPGYEAGTEKQKELDDSLKKAADERAKVAEVMKAMPPDAQKAFTKMITNGTSAEEALTGQLSAETRSKVDSIKGMIDQSQEDYVNFQKNAKIDPNRYLSSMPSTERAINSFLIFLEGMSAAKAMGKGAVVPPVGILQAQMNKAIDQDIALQKDELNRKEGGLLSNVNRYKDNYNLFKNEQAAELKTKAEAYNVAANIFANQSKRWGDDVTAQEAMAKVADFNARALEAQKAAVGVASTTISEQQRPTGPKPIYSPKDKEEMHLKAKKEHEANPIYTSANASVKSAQDLSSSIADVRAGNSQRIPYLKGAIAQAAQGGASRGLTDSDMKVFGPYITLLEEVQGWANEKTTGTMPKNVLDNLDKVAEGIQKLSEARIARRTYNSLVSYANRSGLSLDEARMAFEPSDIQLMDSALNRDKKAAEKSKQSK